MNIPKYIKEILLRSNYVRGRGIPGYQIQIHKSSYYQEVATLMTDTKKLVEWSRKQYIKLCGGDCDNSDEIAYTVKMLDKTTHGDQVSEVVIYDPIMKYFDEYISQSRYEKYQKKFL